MLTTSLLEKVEERRRAGTLTSTNGVTMMLRKHDTANETSAFDAFGSSKGGRTTLNKN